MCDGKLDAPRMAVPGSLERLTFGPHSRLSERTFKVRRLVVSRRASVEQQLQNFQVSALESQAYGFFEEQYPQLFC
jgi:hypothetical protein